MPRIAVRPEVPSNNISRFDNLARARTLKFLHSTTMHFSDSFRGDLGFGLVRRKDMPRIAVRPEVPSENISRFDNSVRARTFRFLNSTAMHFRNILTWWFRDRR